MRFNPASILDSDGKAITQDNPLPVGRNPFVVGPITLALDTNAYTAGDVLATVFQIKLMDMNPVLLYDVTALDLDDQSLGFDILFFSGQLVSLAALNAAWNATDAEMAAKYLGAHVRVAASDFIDLGGNDVAEPAFNPRIIQPIGQPSVYVYTIAQGSSTYTASGLRLWFKFLR